MEMKHGMNHRKEKDYYLTDSWTADYHDDHDKLRSACILKIIIICVL
jgi:hypothetical protein